MVLHSFKNRKLSKNYLYFFILIISLINQIPISIKGVSEQILIPESTNSDIEYTPYISENCTKLGESATNFGNPIDFCIVDYSNIKIAFVATNGPLLAIDITKSSKPKLLYHFDEICDIKFICENNYLLFLSNQISQSLFILDISNPLSPIILFSSILTPFPYRLFNINVNNSLLFAHDDYQFMIFDISNPQEPVLETIFSPLHSIYGLKIENDLAYLFGINIITIIDFSDISNPFVVDSRQHNGVFFFYVNSFIVNDYIYISSFYKMMIFDISNKSSIQLINTLTDSYCNFRSIAIKNNNCYLLDYSNGLRVIDITNPHNLTYISRLPDTGSHLKLLQNDDYLYVLDNLQGLEIFKLDKEGKPAFIARFFLGGNSNDVKIKGNFAYVNNYLNGIEIYRMRNSQTPIFKNRFLVGIQLIEILIQGNYLYALTYKSELYIFDISHEINPRLIHKQSIAYFDGTTTLSVYSFYVYKTCLLVNFRYGGFYRLGIYNFTNFQNNITFVKMFDFYSLSTDFIISNDVLYYVDSTDIQVITLTTYSIDTLNYTLSLLGSLEISEKCYDLFLYNKIIFYVAYYDIFFINVEDPNNPSLFNTYNLHGDFDDNYCLKKLIVESDIIYLNTEIGIDEYGLYMINIEDQTNPYIEGYYLSNETINGVTVENNIVYLANGLLNLVILRLDRFFIPMNYTSLAIGLGSVGIIAIPVTTLILINRRRTKKKAIIAEEKALEQPLVHLDPDEIIIDVKKDEFDSKELFEYAQEIFNDYDEE
ncbi:MAG TPA: hypothetical protein VMZ29_15985 [Candidatus Bathyarchaeia archaeon]|nr:hypothetical protein [Candidatus Bathyarchaeia archaeon]